MKKTDYILLLTSLAIPFNEGIQNDTNTNVFPRIVFWEYEWDPVTASDKKYNTVVVYQTSFFSKTPRHEKLLELISKLAEKNIYVHVYHEYIQEQKYFHSYFALEVLENV
jgi:hypothetical protein